MAGYAQQMAPATSFTDTNTNSNHPQQSHHHNNHPNQSTPPPFSYDQTAASHQIAAGHQIAASHQSAAGHQSAASHRSPYNPSDNGDIPEASPAALSPVNGGDAQKGNRLRKACDSCSIRKVKVSHQYLILFSYATFNVLFVCDQS